MTIDKVFLALKKQAAATLVGELLVGLTIHLTTKTHDQSYIESFVLPYTGIIFGTLISFGAVLFTVNRFRRGTVK